MKSEGEYKSLGEVVTLLSGNTPSKGNQDFWGGSHLWASAKDMKSFFISSTGDGLTDEGMKNVSKIVDAGTTLLLTRGMTLVNDVPICVTKNKASFNQDLKAVIPKDNKIESDFIPYLLLGNKNRIHSLVDLAGHGTGRLATDTLLNLEVFIPNEADRKYIVSLFSSLDEKIELNRQINQTLEQIAQAIFKSWFVDFEPVKAKIEAKQNDQDPERAAMRAICGKTDEELDQLSPDQLQQLATTAALFPDELEVSENGEIPKGWEVKQIQDLAKTIKGKSYKSAELKESDTALVTLKSFNRGGGYRLDGLKEYTGKYKPEQEVFAGDLIIAYTDVTQAADVIGKPAMVISDSRYEHLVISLDVAVVRPEIDSHKYFLYGMAKTDIFQQHTRSYTTGTTVLHLGKTAVPEYKFAKPSEDLLEAYKVIVAPMFELINERIEESKNSERLRDLMLPKLLSGEISIGNTQSTAEAVA